MPRLRLEGSTRLDRAIAYLAPTWALKRQAARARFEMSTNFFRGADYGRLLSDWVTEPQVLGFVNLNYWERETLQVRAQELTRNNPIASAIIDTLVTNVVGQGLQPQSRLRGKNLGISNERAHELRRQAEGVFDRWQITADASGRDNFRSLQALAFRKIIEDGEIIANLPMLKDSWRTLQRGVELIEANRLGTPFGKLNVYDGVEVGEERKEPKSYWIRVANVTTANYEVPRFEWFNIPVRDSRGRPLVLHNYLMKRPGQLRGIPFFASSLGYFKHMGDFYEASVVAAKAAACVAIVISQNDPMDMALAGRQTVAQQPPVNANLEKLEPGILMRLGIGEKADLMDPKGVHEAFGQFMEASLRILGAAAGLPYELLLKDFSKTNYSSARAALQEARRWFMFLRAWFGGRFCQPIWELVLEEAYLAGEFEAHSFYENQQEWCRTQWMGGGWGWVDPVKEVGASIAAIDSGLSTHAKELAGLGEDWEETFEQLVQERQYADALGLIFRAPETATGVGELREATNPVPADEKEAGGEAGPGGQTARSPLPNAPALLHHLAQIARFSKED